jgi:GNAT superfamily N-acetyltransferase
MTVPAWHEEAITRKHDRGAFDCGESDLNEFLLRYARQSHDQGAAKTFLAIDDTTRAILGFYSLAPASLAYQRTPEIIRRGLARHDIPGFRLARIAVDLTQQGNGLGGQLLLAAGRRCLMAAAIAGGTVLIIDAKSDRAVAWYASYGAVPLLDAERTLVLPLATVDDLLKEVGKLVL